MHCEFSETQFVFGILNELVNRCWKREKACTSLCLPTQRKEKDTGFDFSIKGPVRTLFFQFKVPEKKTTSKAKYWSDFGGPYYRFKIWPDALTPQHNNLVKLSNSDPHFKVYYCSPGFHTNKEFAENYNHETISGKSIYVPCKTLPQISGSDKHDISYTIEPARIYRMHSEEFSIPALDLEGLKADMETAVPYENVRQCLIRVAETFSVDIGNADSDIEEFNRIATHLLMTKNLNMILLGQN